MAKQEGILPIKGTIGNITFLKTQDGFLVKQKGGVSADQIAKSPRFKRTRENGSEFGRAAQAGKVFRTAFGSLMQNVADKRVVSRLQAMMMDVLHADKTSIRGQRNVIDGEVSELKDFDFNISAPLNTCLKMRYTTSIDRVTGILTASIPDFIPEKTVLFPEGSTHFKILLAGSEIDFETGEYQTVSKSSDLLDCTVLNVAAFQLTANLPANSTHPLFLALGVEYYQEANDGNYPLNSGAFNALRIVTVDGGV